MTSIEFTIICLGLVFLFFFIMWLGRRIARFFYNMTPYDFKKFRRRYFWLLIFSICLLPQNNILAFIDNETIVSGLTSDQIITRFNTNKEEVIVYKNKLTDLPKNIYEIGTNYEKYKLQDNLFRIKIYPTPQYYFENNLWWDISYVTSSLKSSVFYQSKFIDSANAVVIYPNAGDGFISKSDIIWDNVHNATNGDTATDTNDFDNYIYCASSYQLMRAFFAFDTSVIGSGNQVVSSTFYLYIITKYNDDNDGNDYLNIYSANQNDPTNLVVSDYSTIGNTKFSSDIDLGNININNYYSWTLNTDGRSAINVTGWTKLSEKIGFDQEDHACGPSDSGVRWRASEYTGTAYDPYLEVTYEAIPAEPQNSFTTTTGADMTSFINKYYNGIVAYFAVLIFIAVCYAIYEIWLSIQRLKF